MNRFKGKYKIEGYTPYTFITLAELSYTTKKDALHTVPIGFITDGASIPKIFWSLVGSPFTGLYRRAALIHDYFYHTQKVTRQYADKIFLEAMKYLKVSWLKRCLMWSAVRTNGWMPWNRQKRILKELEDGGKE